MKGVGTAGRWQTMSEEQRKAIKEAIRRANERVDANPEIAKRALVEEGVVTEDGRPGEHYR